MHELGRSIAIAWVIPFAVMLLGIAILPLAAHRYWESNRNRAIFCAVVAAPTTIFLALAHPEALLHTGHEYGSFLALLGSLYVIAGGIHVSGDLRATPATNVALLALGAVLANLVGTTGASMLLIRTLLRTNAQRKHVAHIPFYFVLLVSNCGGLLTPMGDPPLFLGYLRGVPFAWTLGLWPVWLGTTLYLLGALFVSDRRAYAREASSDLLRDAAERRPLELTGWINVPLLGAVIGAIFLPSPWREIAMVVAALASVVLGPRPARAANGFTYAPIMEVAILFAGIFVTMVPALALLEARGAELGLSAPWQFFLVSGSLSSALDNAPTYLTFLSTALGLPETPGATMVAVGDGRVPELMLVAISTGSVLMGANTYIGNGPNFMVRAIAEASGLRMPSFFGYTARAALILLPVLAVMWLVFIR